MCLKRWTKARVSRRNSSSTLRQIFQKLPTFKEVRFELPWESSFRKPRPKIIRLIPSNTGDPKVMSCHLDLVQPRASCKWDNSILHSVQHESTFPKRQLALILQLQKSPNQYKTKISSSVSSEKEWRYGLNFASSYALIVHLLHLAAVQFIQDTWLISSRKRKLRSTHDLFANMHKINILWDRGNLISCWTFLNEQCSLIICFPLTAF